MNETTLCNKCGREFTIDAHRFGSIREGDFVVQYFSCPACGERYHVFTSDKEMRELVGQGRWKELLAKGDPYYNPNFSLDRSDYSLRTDRS